MRPSARTKAGIGAVAAAAMATAVAIAAPNSAIGRADAASVPSNCDFAFTQVNAKNEVGFYGQLNGQVMSGNHWGSLPQRPKQLVQNEFKSGTTGTTQWLEWYGFELGQDDYLYDIKVYNSVTGGVTPTTKVTNHKLADWHTARAISRGSKASWNSGQPYIYLQGFDSTMWRWNVNETSTGYTVSNPQKIFGASAMLKTMFPGPSLAYNYGGQTVYYDTIYGITTTGSLAKFIFPKTTPPSPLPKAYGRILASGFGGYDAAAATTCGQTDPNDGAYIAVKPDGTSDWFRDANMLDMVGTDITKQGTTGITGWTLPKWGN